MEDLAGNRACGKMFNNPLIEEVRLVKVSDLGAEPGIGMADFTRVKCDAITASAPLSRWGVQHETPTARRWGLELSN